MHQQCLTVGSDMKPLVKGFAAGVVFRPMQKLLPAAGTIVMQCLKKQIALRCVGALRAFDGDEFRRAIGTMIHGVLQVADGRWQMAYGVWRMVITIGYPPFAIRHSLFAICYSL